MKFGSPYDNLVSGPRRGMDLPLRRGADSPCLLVFAQCLPVSPWGQSQISYGQWGSRRQSAGMSKGAGRVELAPLGIQPRPSVSAAKRGEECGLVYFLRHTDSNYSLKYSP